MKQADDWMDNAEPHAPVADTSGTSPSTGNHEAGDRIHGTQNKTEVDQDARHEQDTKRHVTRTARDR